MGLWTKELHIHINSGALTHEGWFTVWTSDYKTVEKLRKRLGAWILEESRQSDKHNDIWELKVDAKGWRRGAFGLNNINSKSRKGIGGQSKELLDKARAIKNERLLRDRLTSQGEDD